MKGQVTGTMMILIVGGSGSGKSSYAEKLAVSLSMPDNPMDDCCIKKYYLATMRVWEEEGRRKVERHRELRKGKGFLTIEQPTQIHKALAKMDEGGKVVLLECISNLVANEMFAEEEKQATEGNLPAGENAKENSGMEIRSEAQVTETIIGGIKRLNTKTTHLIIVSNNVFEDGIRYEETTMAYIRAMGAVNRQLAAMAEQVVEVVAGIPVVLKK